MKDASRSRPKSEQRRSPSPADDNITSTPERQPHSRTPSPSHRSPESVPEEDIDCDRPIEEQGYYHGVILREDTERMLKEQGEFLVRKSREFNAPVISVKWKHEVQHYTIKCLDGQHCIQKMCYTTLQGMKRLVYDFYCYKRPLTQDIRARLLIPKRLETWEITEDKIIPSSKKIGKGNFGDVYLGSMLHNDATITIAIKMSNKHGAKEDDKEAFMQEVRIMKEYHHPNIVRFYGVTISKDPMMILMEYVDGGSLIELLKNRKEEKSIYIKMKLMLQAAKGMAYLAERQCIHRDLAARNCLVMKATKCLKISDFGLSRAGVSMTPLPVKWTAPEALREHVFTHSSDVWSYGVLCWEIFNDGALPYPNLDIHLLDQFLYQGKRLSTSNMPQDVGKLVRTCWLQSPEERPTFREVQSHAEKFLDQLN